ncbi:hypothetical protein B0J13DRAFT_48915 [Dactylonectria estremocensis]|uniref:Uncharacterized protein n=1 Tax=Dactylonectria estremocensis TaxID=1079267 RepID=A0A9P9J1I4_9HYPO|nr:hypothetical protein B0J13DRAFT_48915 [Dactylonectria estremocensis]
MLYLHHTGRVPRCTHVVDTLLCSMYYVQARHCQLTLAIHGKGGEMGPQQAKAQARETLTRDGVAVGRLKRGYGVPHWNVALATGPQEPSRGVSAAGEDQEAKAANRRGPAMVDPWERIHGTEWMVVWFVQVSRPCATKYVRSTYCALRTCNSPCTLAAQMWPGEISCFPDCRRPHRGELLAPSETGTDSRMTGGGGQGEGSFGSHHASDVGVGGS